jgi:hypothetical protein
VFTLFKTLSYNLTLISSLFADGIHGYDDLDEINNLIQKKEDLEYSINRCDIEIEINESLLKKLKVKRIDNGVLDKFCNDNGLKIKGYE